MDLKMFIGVNKITQKQLADYLGITEASVSRAVNGKSTLSNARLRKILENDKGWDTSMLAEEGSDPSPQSRDCKDELLDSLRKNIALLEDQVAELKRDKEELREWIKELTRQRKGSD